MGLFKRAVSRQASTLTDVKARRESTSAPLRQSVVEDGVAEQLRRQVTALEAALQTVKDEKTELQATMDKMKTEMTDTAKKDTLRFQILLDMFGLQLLQSSDAKAVEAEQAAGSKAG